MPKKTSTGPGSSFDRIALLFFVASLVFGVFAYGVVVGHFHYPPFNTLKKAKRAAIELIAVFQGSVPTDQIVASANSKGVTRWSQEKADYGLTFYVGKRPNGWAALLVDMSGNILQDWRADFDQIWPHASHIEEEFGPALYHGAHVFPNGDLILNLNNGSVPYGRGIVKLDKDSNVLWSLARNTHHDLNVAEDGAIYALEHELKPAKNSPCRDIEFLSETGRYYEDFILVLSGQGDIIERLSVLEAICGSIYRGLLSPTAFDEWKGRKTINTVEKSEYAEGIDPLHANSVRVASKEISNLFPMADEGDLLVSLRNLNSIGIIDQKTKLFKWMLTGMFVRQHDADFLLNGHISVLDNRGGNFEFGGSRVVEIDPVTQEIAWIYQGSADEKFTTWKAGDKEHLSNGNVLIAETERGRIFEVTNDGEIVWEYFNNFDEKGVSYLGRIQNAFRLECDYMNFIHQSCK